MKKPGGPRELWEADKKTLIETGVPEERVQAIISRRHSMDLDALYGDLAAEGISIVTAEDESYPHLLRQAPGYPKAVFVRGELTNYETAVAIIGSRQATLEGKNMAMELASELADAGVVIVSGAARGIDTAAHWGCIESGGRTVAVLGCGLDVVYPPENRKLFGEILERGCIISEYPPGTAPLAYHFPARNRVVAGMCMGVVVVEAGIKSGALITADFALDYGRDVFAVPGHNRSAMSRGANKLIKQGAYLVETAEDILGALGIEQKRRPQSDSVTELEKEFLEAIGWEAKRFDEVVQIIDGSISSASTLLLSLELSGFIKRDLAGFYLRVR